MLHLVSKKQMKTTLCNLFLFKINNGLMNGFHGKLHSLYATLPKHNQNNLPQNACSFFFFTSKQSFTEDNKKIAYEFGVAQSQSDT